LPRRCHHVTVRPVKDPRRNHHLETLFKDHDRTVARVQWLGRPHQRQPVLRRASTGAMKEESDALPAQLIGARQVTAGSHSMLVRMLLSELPLAGNKCGPAAASASAAGAIAKAVVKSLRLGLAEYPAGRQGGRPFSKSPGRMLVSNPLQPRSLGKWIPHATDTRGGAAKGSEAGMGAAAEPRRRSYISEEALFASLAVAWRSPKTREKVWWPGAALDVVVMLVLDMEQRCLQFAVDVAVSNVADASAAFFSEHQFFDRWSDESILSGELTIGIFDLPSNAAHSFLLEVDAAPLVASGSTPGLGTKRVQLEVLPQVSAVATASPPSRQRSVVRGGLTCCAGLSTASRGKLHMATQHMTRMPLLPCCSQRWQ